MKTRRAAGFRRVGGAIVFGWLAVGGGLPAASGLDMEGRPAWTTYWGGESWESVVAASVNDAGDAFVCGADDGSSSQTGKPDPGPCAYVAKIRTDGHIEWWVWIGRQLNVSAVAATPDGGVCVVGDGPRRHFKDAAPDASEDGLFVLKLGPKGDRQWQTFLTTPGCTAAGLAVDGRGSIYATGNAAPWSKSAAPGPAAKNASGLVFKLSSLGAVEWTRRVDGRGDDRFAPAALAADAQGNLFAGGHVAWGDRGELTRYDLPGLLDPAWRGDFEDGFLVRLSPAGDVQWTRLVGGSRNERVTALALDDRGRLFVGGGSCSPNLVPKPLNPGPIEEGDAFYMRMDSTGKAFWTAFSGLSARADTCRDLWVSADGRAVVGICGAGMNLLEAETGVRLYDKCWWSVLGSYISFDVRAAAPARAAWDLLLAVETPLEFTEARAPTDRNAALTRVRFTPCADPYEPNDRMTEACDLRAHAGQWLKDIQGPAAVADLDWYALNVDPGSPELKIMLRDPQPATDFSLEL